MFEQFKVKDGRVWFDEYALPDNKLFIEVMDIARDSDVDEETKRDKLTKIWERGHARISRLFGSLDVRVSETPIERVGKAPPIEELFRFEIEALTNSINRSSIDLGMLLGQKFIILLELEAVRRDVDEYKSRKDLAHSAFMEVFKDVSAATTFIKKQIVFIECLANRYKDAKKNSLEGLITGEEDYDEIYKEIEGKFVRSGEMKIPLTKALEEAIKDPDHINNRIRFLINNFSIALEDIQSLEQVHIDDNTSLEHFESIVHRMESTMHKHKIDIRKKEYNYYVANVIFKEERKIFRRVPSSDIKGLYKEYNKRSDLLDEIKSAMNQFREALSKDIIHTNTIH